MMRYGIPGYRTPRGLLDHEIERILELGDTAIFLTGPFRSMIDSLLVTTFGHEYELVDTTDQPEIDEHIRRAAFHRALRLALELGQHGREVLREVGYSSGELDRLVADGVLFGHLD